jgi:SH3-like domain-containing protein
MRPAAPVPRLTGALALVLAAALGAPAAAHCADFRSVQENAAVLYDAPSRASKPLFIVSQHYPLEVISASGAWVKVRDHAGALSWIERKSLGDKRMVLVTVPLVEVRARPEDGAPAAFSATQNVVLELIETSPAGWMRVRHPDGSSGYLRPAQVWGD